MINAKGKLIPGRPLALIGKKKIDILHTSAKLVDSVDKEIIILASRMYATVKHIGHAIAANQIGIPINLIVLADGLAYINVSINPDLESGMEPGVEGCLSLPGRHYLVDRYLSIEFSGTTLKNEIINSDVEGFEARMWQHEFDHLNGKLLSEQFPEIKG